MQALIGSGGMGVLYLAVDPRIDRRVALKVLRVSSSEFKARFLHEARAAGRLSHPNIVTIFDVGDHEGQPYIAMEYVPGDTLRSLIAGHAALSYQRRLSLMVQLCDGLGFAHRAGIVHRDIKPANLLLSRESGMLKILDFGIARSGASTLTGAGASMGTLNYMSPEQARGQKLDHRSDIFAVGLVLYELLAFRQAFPGDDRDAVLSAILNEEPEPLDSLNADLDAALEQIVARALAKNPDERYGDLRAMQSDLARALQRIEEAHGGDTVVDLEPIRPDTAILASGYRARIAELREQRIGHHLAAASASLDANALDAARAALEEAAVIDLDDPRVLAVLERLRSAENRVRAGEMLEDAEQHLAAGDLTIAIDIVDDALRLAPDVDELLDARRRVEQAVAVRERDRQILQKLDEADQMLSGGTVETALRTAQDVLTMVPSHPRALSIVARCEDILAARRAREERERHVRQTVEDALSAADEGRYDEALGVLGTLDPDHPLVQETVAAVGVAQRLEQDRRELLAWSDGVVVQARASLEEGAWDATRAHLEAALERLSEPAAPGLAEHQGRARLRVSRELDIVQYLCSAKERIEQHDYPGAMGVLDAALAVDPGHRVALELQSEAERAREIAERRRRRETMERLIQEGIGIADQEYERGDIHEAIARLEGLGSSRAEVVDRLTRWRAQL